jgi:hypothetical protein
MPSAAVVRSETLLRPARRAARRGEGRDGGAVYDDFYRRGGADGYEVRRAALLETVSAVARPRDLAALPPNDLVSSPLADELRALGAFRADVSGAGPTVYGLFHHRQTAVGAQRRLRSHGRTWLTAPAWYG